MPLSLAGMRYLYQRLLATSPAEERWGKSALWVLPQWHALLPCSLIRNYYSDLWQCLLGLWSWVKALKKTLCWVLNFLCKALSLSWRVSNLIFERKQKGDAGKASTLLPLGCTHFNSCHLKMKIYGFKAKANVLFPLSFIKFLGISLFTRLNSSSALGCGSGHQCASWRWTSAHWRETSRLSRALMFEWKGGLGFEARLVLRWREPVCSKLV